MTLELVKPADSFAPARRALWNPLSQEAVIRAAVDVLSESTDPADIAMVREHRMRLFAQPGAELKGDYVRTAEAYYEAHPTSDVIDLRWLSKLAWRVVTHGAAFVAGIVVCAHVGGLL